MKVASEGSDSDVLNNNSPKQNRNEIILSIRKSMRKIKCGKVMKLMETIWFASRIILSPFLSISVQNPFQSIFQKISPDLDASGSDNKKLAKIVVECRKEGLVNYLSPECLKNENKDHSKLDWVACKLVLVKSTGGYMLEFHSLDKTAPKVSQTMIKIDWFWLSTFSFGTTDAERYLLLLN